MIPGISGKYGRNVYACSEILKIFYSLSVQRRYEIYDAVFEKQGSKEYKIAKGLGFRYEDEGVYTIPVENDIYVNYERDLKINNLLDNEAPMHPI